jgi:hypothetical protein
VPSLDLEDQNTTCLAERGKHGRFFHWIRAKKEDVGYYIRENGVWEGPEASEKFLFVSFPAS